MGEWRPVHRLPVSLPPSSISSSSSSSPSPSPMSYGNEPTEGIPVLARTMQYIAICSGRYKAICLSVSRNRTRTLEPSNLSTREESLVERRVDLDRYFSGAYGFLGSRYHLPISCQTAIRKPLSIAPLSQSISLTRVTFHSFFLPSDLDLLFICCPYIFRQSPRRATPS